MRYFTSDTHFGHKNIIAYSNRPFRDYTEMDWKIVDNWNHIIGPTDVVYHLGDVAMGPSERWDEILTALNGYKVLVVGNHDRIFKGMSANQNAKWEEKYHEWFDEVTDNLRGLELSNGTVVNLSHFPYDGDSHDGDRYTEFRLEDRGTPLIHGHTHAEYEKLGINSMVSYSKSNTLQIHVGMDAWNYTPVSEDQIVTLMEAVKDNG